MPDDFVLGLSFSDQSGLDLISGAGDSQVETLDGMLSRTIVEEEYLIGIG
jgi:hypothetical protein